MTAEEKRPNLAEEAMKLAEVLIAQAGEVKDKVVTPLVEKHPETAAHLAAAGTELAAAYRTFVADTERRWAARNAKTEKIDLDD
jgi:hypothetical protein